VEDNKYWKQLDLYCDLYKFYWGLAIKLCVFILGLSGAIAAYALKNQAVPLIHWALFLPFFLCIFGAKLSKDSLPNLEVMRDEVVSIAGSLGLDTHPEFTSLVDFTKALRYVFIITLIGLLAIFAIVRHAS
jgi:hypothetical protein